MIELDEFLKLPTEEVARLVRASGPKVCVFPINGTRRWFVLEHSKDIEGDPIEAYMQFSSQRQLELCGMLFDHGIDTLLTPVLGPDLFERGDEYVQRIGIEGLRRAATAPQFLNFYKEKGVRIRFYGDYKFYLKDTPYGQVCDLLDVLVQQTARNNRCRLFFGVFAHDSTQTIAELSIDFFKTTGRVPDKRELIEKYYGEYVGPADIFIGFDRFRVFDMPLISTGEEDLYFSVSPSPYMTEQQLRSILYDHLYTRRVRDPEYSSLSPDSLKHMRDFYLSNRNTALGIGTIESDVWIPVQPGIT
jgi:tuberculosinol/isotuberculosinol synthase